MLKTLIRISVFTLTVLVPLSQTAFIFNNFETFNQENETLLLVHVVFRHGNRTADGPHELYPKNPFSEEKYFPYGLGQLTNVGKQKMFNVGKTLRMRYNNLLGKYYYPNEIEAYSTDYNRTKMSLQLVLAGLFPPAETQIWEKELLWQPVPFNYLPKYQDKVLLGVLCPRYLEMYEKISASTEFQEKFNVHKDVFRYISTHTGLNISRFLDVYNLYFGISTQEEWGFKLPLWTKKVWPEIMTQLAIKDYFVSMATNDMRKMAIGYLLQKMIEDTKNKILSSNKEGKKMYLYSAHENTLAELMMSLGLFEPHIPTYGSFLALEVHEIDKVFGVKIYYENYSGEGIRILKIPGCSEFCPLDKLIEFTKEYMPSTELCGI